MQTNRARIGASSGRRITVNGVRLAYDDEGSGPPLVCLHAIGHGAGDYAPLRERLKHRYRVIALDWPGQGQSDAEEAPPSDGRYAEHLEAFVRALGLEQIVLLGNSIGGAAAIRFAARHPGAVRALIVANSAGLFHPLPGVRSFIRLMARVFARGAAGASWYPRFFAAYYRRVLRCEPAAEQRANIIAARAELAPLLARAWRGFAEPSADIRHLAEQVRCPVLVAWATRDPVNHLWINRAGIRRFPDAQLVTFRAGHSPFLEQPDDFSARLVAFTEQVEALGSSARARVVPSPSTGSRAHLS